VKKRGVAEEGEVAEEEGLKSSTDALKLCSVLITTPLLLLLSSHISIK
jgi:hypothetical protein